MLPPFVALWGDVGVAVNVPSRRGRNPPVSPYGETPPFRQGGRAARSCAVGWNSGRMISAPTREEDFGAAVESGGSKQPPYGYRITQFVKTKTLIIPYLRIYAPLSLLPKFYMYGFFTKYMIII